MHIDLRKGEFGGAGVSCGDDSSAACSAVCGIQLVRGTAVPKTRLGSCDLIDVIKPISYAVQQRHRRKREARRADAAL